MKGWWRIEDTIWNIQRLFPNDTQKKHSCHIVETNGITSWIIFETVVSYGLNIKKSRLMLVNLCFKKLVIVAKLRELL